MRLAGAGLASKPTKPKPFPGERGMRLLKCTADDFTDTGSVTGVLYGFKKGAKQYVDLRDMPKLPRSAFEGAR